MSAFLANPTGSITEGVKFSDALKDGCRKPKIPQQTDFDHSAQLFPQHSNTRPQFLHDVAPRSGAENLVMTTTRFSPEGEVCRAWEVGSAHVEPATAVLLHLAAGMLHAGRGQQQQALEAFTAAA